jgi:hypothetical protein
MGRRPKVNTALDLSNAMRKISVLAAALKVSGTLR